MQETTQTETTETQTTVKVVVSKPPKEKPIKISAKIKDRFPEERIRGSRYDIILSI